MRVADLLLSTAATLAQLGFAKLDEATRDLEQARLAIEGARALQGLVPQEGLQQVRDALSQLQMAYVREAQPETAEGRPQTAGAEAPTQPQGQAAEEEERAKARSKIWTPPGS